MDIAKDGVTHVRWLKRWRVEAVQDYSVKIKMLQRFNEIQRSVGPDRDSALDRDV